MSVKLHHLEFLSLKGGYTGSAESTFIKMPHCWESHVVAHVMISLIQMSDSGPFVPLVCCLYYTSCDMRFPAMWHFDKCRLRCF